MGTIGYILRLYGDNGEEHGNYYLELQALNEKGGSNEEHCPRASMPLLVIEASEHMA